MLLLLISLVIFVSTAAIVYFSLPSVTQRLDRWQEKKAEETERSLNEAFIFVSHQKLILYNLLTLIIFSAVGYFLLKNILGLIIGAFIGLSLPTIISKYLKIQHKKKFESQLVDTITMLSGSLKAGHSLKQSFEVVTREIPPPTSQEFGLVLKEMEMGVNLDTALLHLKNRMNIDMLDMVVTAVLVARQTGADITQIFTQLVETIREESKLKSKVGVLCVQGKIQGVVIGLLPIVFGLFVTKVQPKFFDTMLNDPLGKMLLGYALISQIIGIILIKILSKVEI